MQKERNIDLQEHDLHIVSFELGDRIYGIDIMSIKEISNTQHFTPVPNTAEHVSGVFNLRGEIIPVIDLRVFLELESITESAKSSSLIILSIKENRVAVIVDAINQVFSVDSRRVQKEHFLYSDIRGHYIAGILEHQHSLYIILNMENIIESSNIDEGFSTRLQRLFHKANKLHLKQEQAAQTNRQDTESQEETQPLAASFNSSFNDSSYYINRFNQDYFQEQSEEQFSAKEPYFSLNNTSLKAPCQEQIWSKEFFQSMKNLISERSFPSNFHAWLINCAQGEEAYSFAAVLKESLKAHRLRLLASDYRYNLISQAVSLAVSPTQITDIYQESLERPSNSGYYTFKDSVSSMITFDLSEPLMKLQKEKLHIILARNTLSRYQDVEAEKVFSYLWEKLEAGGFLLLAPHEKIAELQPYKQTAYFTSYQKEIEANLQKEE